MDPLLAGLVQDFVDENLVLAQQIGTAVLALEEAWERHEHADGALKQVKAALHTIKGGAAMMGLRPIETLAHALEDVCAHVGSGSDRRGRREIEIMLEGADLLVGLIRRTLDGPLDPAASAGFLEHVDEVVKRTKPSPAPSAVESVDRAEAPGGGGGAVDDTGTSTVRIHEAKVEELMELAGETMVSHTEIARIQHLCAKGRLTADDQDIFERVVTALGRTVNRLGSELLRIRLMPVSSMFVRFRRYVRDLAQDKQQPITLTIEGAETTLDRAVLSRLHEPLLHLVRNAVAHGIEPPDVRVAAGKPREANILLAAKLVSGRVKIAVVDDGRGIDLGAIARKAAAVGLGAPGMTDEELRRLIFLPGFSTASSVSKLAGRGIGLDVVADVIHGLGGSVDVESVPSAGTAFLLDLPVSVSQVKALLLEVDGERFVVPLGFVIESVTVEPTAIHNVGPTRVLPWRNDLVPVLDTGVLVGTRDTPVSTRRYCLVLGSGNKRRGLLVDRLLERQEIVVKSLDGELGAGRIVFGLCILGDGRVAPIIDCAHVLGQGNSARGPVATMPRPEIAATTGV